MKDLFFIVFGYLGGSLLFARIFVSLFKHKDVTKDTKDANPGAANAFKNGGFWCGILTLSCDLLKGFLPVYLYMRGENISALALVIAAPVIGHIFPVFYGFRGGKGISTTFGCLLGLIPILTPVFLLAVVFIFFSVVLRVSSHYYRTLVTYLCVEIMIFFTMESIPIKIGVTLIVISVYMRMLTSKEEKESNKVGLLWMH